MKLSAKDIQIVDVYEKSFDLYSYRTVIDVRFRGMIYEVAYVHSLADGYNEEDEDACFELEESCLIDALIEAMGGMASRDEAEELINSACAPVIEADGGIVLGYSA